MLYTIESRAYIVTLNSSGGNPSWSTSLTMLSPALSNTLRKDSLQRVTDESSSSGTSSLSAAMFSLATISPSPSGVSPFRQRLKYNTRSSGEIYMCTLLLRLVIILCSKARYNPLHLTLT